MGDDPAGAEQLRHLNGQRSDAAGRGVDEDALALFQGARGLYDVVGGEALEGDGCCLVEAEGVGHRDQGRCGSDGVLRVAAGVEQRDDPVALGGVLDAIPHLDDGACDLRAWSKGKLLSGQVLVAAAHGVRVVDAGSLHLDEDFSLTGRGTLCVHVLEDIGLSEFVRDYRLHLRHFVSNR